MASGTGGYNAGAYGDNGWDDAADPSWSSATITARGA